MKQPFSIVQENAASARDILSDPVVTQAFENMRSTYLDAIRQATYNSAEVLEACVKIKMIDEFIQEMRRAVTEETLRRRGG